MQEETVNFSTEESKRILFDHLMYAKALIIRQKFLEAEPVLHKTFSLLKIIKLNRKEIMKVIIAKKQENKLDHGEELGSKLTGAVSKSVRGIKDFTFYRTIMATYATVAALFSHIGNQKMAEEVYEVYAKIVEKNYGNNR